MSEMRRWEEIAWGAKDACDKAGEMLTRKQEEIVRVACLDAFAAGAGDASARAMAADAAYGDALREREAAVREWHAQADRAMRLYAELEQVRTEVKNAYFLQDELQRTTATVERERDAARAEADGLRATLREIGERLGPMVPDERIDFLLHGAARDHSADESGRS